MTVIGSCCLDVSVRLSVDLHNPLHTQDIILQPLRLIISSTLHSPVYKGRRNLYFYLESIPDIVLQVDILC